MIKVIVIVRYVIFVLLVIDKKLYSIVKWGDRDYKFKIDSVNKRLWCLTIELRETNLPKRLNKVEVNYAQGPSVMDL